jgi:hypothetical protein
MGKNREPDEFLPARRDPGWVPDPPPKDPPQDPPPDDDPPKR